MVPVSQARARDRETLGRLANALPQSVIHFFIHPAKGLRLAVDLDYGVYGSALTAAVTGLTLSLVTPEGLSKYTTNLGHDLGHVDIRTIIHTHLTAKETTA